MLAMLSMLMPNYANAYEEEDAVPVTISTQNEYGNIVRTSIKISGKNVEIGTLIQNNENTTRRIGFSAQTPFFTQFGQAEDNENKTFSDLTVIFNKKLIQPMVYRRGFFLGEDITAKLVKNRTAPLPTKDADTKGLFYRGLPVADWQGYVAYSWITDLSPKSSNSMIVNYRALPQFGREKIYSDVFNQYVAAHCGNPEKIRNYFKNINTLFDSVLFERYEIPVKYLSRGTASIEIKHSIESSADEQPLLSLVCGISERTGEQPNISGNIETKNNMISILVLSRFLDSIAEGK